MKITLGDKKVGLLQVLNNQKYLLLMSVPFVIWLVIFRYLPLWGWNMAFQEYKPGRPVKWVGLYQFIRVFSEPQFYVALRNTLGMSILGLVLGTATAVFFALLINEIQHYFFKRSIQTISYLPNFVSWVIVAAMWTKLLSLSGTVNEILVNLKIVKQPIDFFAKKEYFWWIVTFISIWKDTGWNTIIYLAAITGINPETYEAAVIDGAGRWRQMWYITLPAILPTIAVITIMNIGWIISIGLEKQYLLGNQLIKDYALVIDWYVLERGIQDMKYSFGTAVGIFKSLVSVVLVVLSNWLAKRLKVTYIF